MQESCSLKVTREKSRDQFIKIKIIIFLFINKKEPKEQNDKTLLACTIEQPVACCPLPAAGPCRRDDDGADMNLCKGF